jgi:hypothetical protein
MKNLFITTYYVEWWKIKYFTLSNKKKNQLTLGKFAFYRSLAQAHLCPESQVWMGGVRATQMATVYFISTTLQQQQQLGVYI